MEYRITERGTELTVGNCFDLRNTFECGQCFRWNEDTDSPVCSYTGIAKNKQLRISFLVMMTMDVIQEKQIMIHLIEVEKFDDRKKIDIWKEEIYL